MKFQTLKYFIVLAEELHFGKAAARLSITQPPLSTAIKLLEEELRVTLFDRTKSSVQLTETGKAFLTEANNIIESTERAKKIAASTQNGSRGHLNIGFCGTLIFRDIINSIKEFKDYHPHIEISLHEMNSQQQVDALTMGNIHLGFMYGYEPPEPLSFHQWIEDRYELCIPADHPKAHQTLLNLEDFKNEKFIMFERTINPKNFDTVMQSFAHYKFSPKIAYHTKSWMTSLSMVSEGCGIAILPHSLTKAKMQGVKIIPLNGLEIISSSCYAWSSEKINASGRNFSGFLKKNNKR